MIGIVGAGAMGRAVAEAAAKAGFETVLVKATPGDLAVTRRAIAESLGLAVHRGALSQAALEATLGRLTLAHELDAIAGCSVVIESVREDLEAKQRILALVEARVSIATVLASTTATLPLALLAEGMRAPMRFVGLRFGEGDVQIATTQRTYPNAVEVAQQLAVALGRTPVILSDRDRIAALARE
jgi:3-hydroxyacyl-CoA dehydrogenase